MKKVCASLVLVLVVALAGAVEAAQSVALRVDFAEGAGGPAVPVAGGVPFPKGALKSADQVRLLRGGREIPCQVAKTAVWPDGSVKWVMVDALLKPTEGEGLSLEYGDGVARAAVTGGLQARVEGGKATVRGGGVEALIDAATPAVVDALTLNGKAVADAAHPVRLILNALRIEDGTKTGGEKLPLHTYMARDAGVKYEEGAVKIATIAVESPGPIRATIRILGHVALPSFGATLPDKLKGKDAAGQVPFSLRLSFYKDSGVVFGQHQIIFTGEPDCDFISSWGLEIPNQAGARGTRIAAPGIELHTAGGKTTVAPRTSRLCWAPLKDGFALIRNGWENRACGVEPHGANARVAFWSEEEGVFDLRRYAREWAVGESGDLRNPEQIKFYAQFAAYGIAKSHDFVLNLGAAPGGGAAPAEVKALARRALVLASPAWYAASEALGPFAPEQRDGPYAAVDAAARRRLDYHLYCQDLYRWHGQLEYGNWQSRYGQVHRNDRWDNDYGRWGWALNDGAGRIGHILMLHFLRTGERRYFDAGAAFNRINYDTNMVHTYYHLENAKGWWKATGSSHRHNVQPFGCPYIGMRGSNPVGQRILHLLTGDGVIEDGLELVAGAAFEYATGNGSRLCNSGGSDGQGTATNALLWKYETTGEKKYLDACRTILDKSGLIPPQKGKGLGYGPSFGLFNAAGEYADLAGDKAFVGRVVEVGKKGAGEKNASPYVYAIAMAYRFTKDAALKAKLEKEIVAAGKKNDGIEDLPPARWPGHGGWRTPRLDASWLRDGPYAMGVVVQAGDVKTFPPRQPNLKPLPAETPKGWYAPGGVQTANEKVPAFAQLDALKPGGGGGGSIKAGQVTWTAKQHLADDVEVYGARPLNAPLAVFVELATPKGGHGNVATKAQYLTAKVTAIGPGEGDSLVAKATAGGAQFTIRLRKAAVDGVEGVRAEVACKVAEGHGRVTRWGLLVPLKLGQNQHAITATRPGAFRLERTRLNQNDEKVPSWLAAMEGRENCNHWPLWRHAGLDIGPGPGYRVWHAAESNVVPVFVDKGEGSANWMDVTDRGGNPHWGFTARILRNEPAATDANRYALRANLVTGLFEIQFHSAAAEPIGEAEAAAGLSGAADLLFHDGWRPPLSRPQLDGAGYAKFLKDIDIGENYGLMAYRYSLSTTHKVKGVQWMEKIRDLGVEPRELLYSMQPRNGLANFAQKIGVTADANDVEGTIEKIMEHYRK